MFQRSFHYSSGGRNLKSTLYLVVPCYNEESVVRETAARLCAKLKTLAAAGRISEAGKIVFVDDGSSDATWEIIEKLSAEEPIFAGIRLSCNKGHQLALLAGLMEVRSEANMVISIDADLQDDIEAIDGMLDEYFVGCDIVYGVRRSREKDSFLKRATAEGYYKLLRSCGCDIVFNHADFRLMSSRAIAALSEYREQRVFLRGLVPLLGFRTAIVEYDRGARDGGISKYSMKRMMSLAFDGLLSLSLRPLRLVTVAGALMIIAAIALLIHTIVMLSIGQTLPDWKYVTLSLWGVGGIITLSLGIVGEYVGRAYMEVKRRPRWVIDRTTGLHQPRSEL